MNYTKYFATSDTNITKEEIEKGIDMILYRKKQMKYYRELGFDYVESVKLVDKDIENKF